MIVSNHTVSVDIPRIQGVLVYAAVSTGGMSDHVDASSKESVVEAKRGLALWLQAVNAAVQKELGA